MTIRQLQVTGSKAEVVGQASFAMTDFGLQPPRNLPITAVQPQVALEFQLSPAGAG